MSGSQPHGLAGRRRVTLVQRVTRRVDRIQTLTHPVNLDLRDRVLGLVVVTQVEFTVGEPEFDGNVNTRLSEPSALRAMIRCPVRNCWLLADVNSSMNCTDPSALE